MKKTELCAYRYDPLDRLIGIKSNQQSDNLRFYCKSRLATEIKGNQHHAIMQHGDQLLAQQTYNATDQTNALLATDLQRSVLCTVTDDEQLHNAYAPYGYTKLIRAQQALSFNGERPELITGHYLLGNGYRAFNPILMRFNSPDSWSPFGKGGINTYTYCMNSPINSHDPSGHIPLFITRQLKNWLGRARKNLLNNTIEFPRLNRSYAFNQDYYPAALKTGISRDEAYKARNQIYENLKLGNETAFKNQKFLADYHRTAQGSSTLKSQAAHVVKSNNLPTEDLPKDLILYVKDLSPPPEHAMFSALKNPDYGTVHNSLAYRLDNSSPDTHLDYVSRLGNMASSNYNTYNNNNKELIEKNFILRKK